MEEKNMLLTFGVRPDCGKPVREQPLVDQFIVEWQIGQMDSGEEGSSQLQAKFGVRPGCGQPVREQPLVDQFVVEWQIG